VALDLAGEIDSADLSHSINSSGLPETSPGRSVTTYQLEDLEQRLSKQEALTRRVRGILKQFIQLANVDESS
jgi:hypothetical protein